MSSDNLKEVLSRMVNRAAEYSDDGNVVNRGQVLRDIEDLPLPPAYVCAALKAEGLLKYYKGRKP